MTNNHLLIYRIAELMLESEQHILSVDLLFDDEQIGDFVKSIQIDSPYQQMLFEGILTESVKDEKLYVSFTVEGYFHYVLGEVIFNLSQGVGSDFIATLFDNNKLNGIVEGIKHCLIRDVEKQDLSRIINLIDRGSCLDVCILPLASAFLQIKGNFKSEDDIKEAYQIRAAYIMDYLLNQKTENDIEVLKNTISQLERLQKPKIVAIIYANIYKRINPENIQDAILYLDSIQYIPSNQRIQKLNALRERQFPLEMNDDSVNLYLSLARQYEFVADYDKAIEYYEKLLAIGLRSYNDNDTVIGIYYNNLGVLWGKKFSNDKAIEYLERCLAIYLERFGEQHEILGVVYNNLGNYSLNNGNVDKAIEYQEKSLEIRIKVHGSLHPHTASTFNSLGNAWSENGDFQKATVYYEKSLDVYNKTFGDQHHYYAISLHNLGRVWGDIGDFDKAHGYLEKALPIFINVYGLSHSDSAAIYNDLGLSWKDKGDYDKAIYFLDRSLEINLQLYSDYGINQQAVGMNCISLGSLWKGKGEYDKTKYYYTKAHEIFSKIHGADDKNTRWLFQKLKELNAV